MRTVLCLAGTHVHTHGHRHKDSVCVRDWRGRESLFRGCHIPVSSGECHYRNRLFVQCLGSKVDVKTRRVCRVYCNMVIYLRSAVFSRGSTLVPLVWVCFCLRVSVCVFLCVCVIEKAGFTADTHTHTHTIVCY